ncbi:MAG: hypothetical protein R2932_57260 [Caldilineaceae bacterium]
MIQEWRRCQLDSTNNNTIEGFNRSGQIQVHLPQMEGNGTGGIE